MTTDKVKHERIVTDLNEAIMDLGNVECEQVPDIFYPEDFSGSLQMREMAVQTARKICLRCPVIAKCLKAGMYEEYGIWGGTTPEQRKRLKRQQII